MNINKAYQKVLLVLFILIGLNYISSLYSKRFDMTRDGRYTLSKETVSLVEGLEKPLIIKVYLQGDFPAEFKRIQLETNQFLEELNALNEGVKFRFVNPLTNTKKLIEKGLQPSRLSVQEGGKVSEAVIFPWAIISYDGKEEKVSLLVNSIAGSQEEQLQKSIENLEYAFATAIHKISNKKLKKIAILKGNNQPDDIYLFSFLKKLGEYYRLAEFTLDSVDLNPINTLNDLSAYDLSIIVKPGKAFSEKEKLLLDQFIMNGGKTLWLLDKVNAEMDSLMVNGKSLAFNRDLNLTDLLFSYGLRINYNITKDLYSSTIRLASGNTGNQIQYKDFLWHYFPLIFSKNNHPITKNIDPVLLKFPSSIDTLDNGIKKTIILKSSALARVIGTPSNIALSEIAQEPDQKSFIDSYTSFGVLLEGEFKSAYDSRVLPFNLKTFQRKGKPNKMIVISDGDIALNEVLRGEPLALNNDKWTNQTYGNMDFLLNSIHYLLDDQGLIQLRSKALQIQFLDKEKAYAERVYWQLFNLILPLLLLFGFGWVFNFLRKKRYN